MTECSQASVRTPLLVGTRDKLTKKINNGRFLSLSVHHSSVSSSCESLFHGSHNSLLRVSPLLREKLDDKQIFKQ